MKKEVATVHPHGAADAQIHEVVVLVPRLGASGRGHGAGPNLVQVLREPHVVQQKGEGVAA